MHQHVEDQLHFGGLLCVVCCSQVTGIENVEEKYFVCVVLALTFVFEEILLREEFNEFFVVKLVLFVQQGKLSNCNRVVWGDKFSCLAYKIFDIDLFKVNHCL